MAVVLATLQVVFTATSITAPKPLDLSAIRVAPTAAARALTAARLDRLLPSPVTVTLQCLVGREARLTDCIPAEDGGTTNLAAYRQRLFARGTGGTDSVVAVALARAPYYRTRLIPSLRGQAASFLLRETVSASDLPALGDPRGVVTPKELPVTPGVIDISDFYPPAALRADAQNKVTATCRVLADYSLLYRDPRVNLPSSAGQPPAWRSPSFDPDFERATLRALATMRVQPRTVSGEASVGYDVQVNVNWHLPRDSAFTPRLPPLPVPPPPPAPAGAP